MSFDKHEASKFYWGARFFLYVMMAIFVVGGLAYQSGYFSDKSEEQSSKTHKARVSRVIDGDTLELTSGERVRLIGIDCPEFKDQERNKENAERLRLDAEHYASYAQKSKNYMRRIEGVAAKLEHDETNESISHLDKYGRTLAYVYAYAFAKVKAGFEPDGVSEKWADDDSKGNVLHLMNAKLIADGYCTAYTRFDFKYKDEFVKLEQEAREARRGLWG